MRPLRSVVAALCAATLLLGLAGCGDDGASAADSATGASPRPLSSFDLVVVASESNDALAADLYGITLDPLTAVRITHDKRISTVDAQDGRVVVAAADGAVDQLAFVTAAGELTEIPGLGRPFAYNPSFVDNHTLMFDDVLVPEEDVQVNRTLLFDETERAKSTLFQIRDNLISSAPGPEGQVALVRSRKNGRESVVIRAADGATRETSIEGDIGELLWGSSRYIAVAMNNVERKKGDDPSAAVILLDPVAGKQLQLGLSQPIAWNPDASRLLVRRTGDAAGSQLAWFDPTNPQGELTRIGGITNLVIYSGAWVA
ncbi:hypothetical protein [Sporichthya polymorpha]|uniref:hypothetical protein n=1 Tax=Sporichthya polymorpha TaxID=35751 RepID=UPI000366C03D|nr:hypothetical protein [Sporichthya polymorpha]